MFGSILIHRRPIVEVFHFLSLSLERYSAILGLFLKYPEAIRFCSFQSVGLSERMEICFGCFVLFLNLC